MLSRFRLALTTAAALVGLTAVLTPQASAGYGTSLWVHVSGSGSVNGSGGYACPDSPLEFEPGTCAKYYDKFIVVNLVASPDPGWIFSGWSGCNVTSGTTCQVVIPEQLPPLEVSVSFTKIVISPIQHPLSVSVSGPGHVTGPGIECPSDCSQSFAAGSWVTLQAQSEPLATFTGWSGACTSGPTAACVVKMDAARDVTANFAANVPIGQPRSLAVEVGGSGSGKVTSGSAIDCPGDCSHSYSVSTDVTLTATPASGSTFAGWSGACSGSAPTCQVTMSMSRTVMATFEKPPVGSPADPGNPGNAPSSPGAGKPGAVGTPTEACTITGTARNDVLVGTSGPDVICGLGGNDRLLGKGGDDLLVGGAGADVLDGGRGRDLLYGGLGGDRLYGGAGRDRLDAGAGNDRLVGHAGIDRLLGGKGADLLLARDGVQDRVEGGAGRDRAQLDRVLDRQLGVETLF